MSQAQTAQAAQISTSSDSLYMCNEAVLIDAFKKCSTTNMFRIASLTPYLYELALDKTNWWPRYEKMFIKKCITENSIHSSYYCNKSNCNRPACYWGTLEAIPKVPKKWSTGDPFFLFARRAKELYMKHYPKWGYNEQHLYDKHKCIVQASKNELKRLQKIKTEGTRIRAGMELVEQEEIRLAKRKREDTLDELRCTLQTRKRRLISSQKRLEQYKKITEQHMQLVKKTEYQINRIIGAKK